MGMVPDNSSGSVVRSFVKRFRSGAVFAELVVLWRSCLGEYDVNPERSLRASEMSMSCLSSCSGHPLGEQINTVVVSENTVPDGRSDRTPIVRACPSALSGRFLQSPEVPY